jgi:hypothetical protein
MRGAVRDYATVEIYLQLFLTFDSTVNGAYMTSPVSGNLG